MRSKKLSKLLDISIGRTPSRNEPAYWGEGHPWVSIRDLCSKTVTETKEQITDLAVKEARCKIVRKGTLLFSFKLTIGKMAFAGCDLFTNEAIAAFPVKDDTKLNPEFLYYALGSATYGGSNQAVMGKTLNSKSLAEIEIPLPPLDDQKRIAHLLGKVEGLIVQRKHHLQQLDDLLKSVFLEMFGDPVRNEKGWSKKPLAMLGNLDRGVSKHRPRNAPELLDGKYPLIQTGDVSNAGTYITGFKQTYSELGFSQSKLWPAGTLCITIAANIAQTGILTFDACFPDSVVGFTADEREANPLYVLGLFWFFQRILEKNAPAAAQKNINLKILRALEVPTPPIGLQNQFAAIVEMVESLKSRYQQSLINFESLYGVLSQKAFKGELDLSRVVLPVEGPEITEEEIGIEEKQPMEPWFELPAPEELALLQTAEGRKSLLCEWLNSWLAQLGDAPFAVQKFMDAARQRLWELAEDEAPDWGVAEYDELKSWVFEALEQGRLTQGYDDANNRVQITAVKG